MKAIKYSIKYLMNVCLAMSMVGSAYSQSHTHSASCLHHEEIVCKENVDAALKLLPSNAKFKQQFKSAFAIDYVQFTELNSFEMDGVYNYVSGEVCHNDRKLSEVGNIIIEVVNKVKDNFLFEKITFFEDEYVKQVSKYGYISKKPKKDEDDGSPKTALCENAGFEYGNHTAWNLTTGTVTGSSLGGTSAPWNPMKADEHTIWTGGNDPVSGFPRVYQGGASARIGNGNSNGGHYGRLRKQFTVSASNPSITYAYMAVLQDPGRNHQNREKPFFSAKMYRANGQIIQCAEYFAYAGDGQAGWITGGQGGSTYRDWTAVFVPLHAYIGETLTLEFTAGDCSQSGHYGYAYVDVDCSNLEIEQFCEGTETVLQAPTEGVQSYLWSTGATTSSITITTPGVYTVSVLPYGSNCPATLTMNATIYPKPTASFTSNRTTVCSGGDITFTNTSTTQPGSVVKGYQWDYGDWVITPSRLGTMTNIPFTTGTYDGSNTHIFHPVNTLDVKLIMETTDGCTDTTTQSIIVVQGPEATIAKDTAVCAMSDMPEITFTGFVTTGPFTFTYNINGGPDQYVSTFTGDSTVKVSVPTNVPGTYNYNLTYVLDPSVPMCEQAQFGTATVVIEPLPTATISGSTVVCQNGNSPSITFTGNNPAHEYIFTYSINGGVPQTVETSGSNVATVDVPTSISTVYLYELLAVENLVTGCSQAQTGTAIVSIDPTPSATIGGRTAVCQDAAEPTIHFTGINGTGDYTFRYTINGGPVQVVTSSGINTASVNQPTNVPGTFVYELLEVMDPNTSCKSDVNLLDTITVQALPAVSIVAPINACYFDTVLPVLNVTGLHGTAPFTFTYNINGGTPQYATSNDSVLQLQHLTNTIGSFVYTITHIQEGSVLACEQNQDVSSLVTIHELPIVGAGTDFSSCDGQEIKLVGTGAQTYVWDNGVTDRVLFIPPGPGNYTYTVIGTDHNGCKNTDKINVTVIPIPVVDIIGQNLYGCQPLEPIFTNNSTGNLVDCKWYLGNGETFSNCGTFSTVFENVGCYDVTLEVTTPEGCTNSLTMVDYVCVEGMPIAQFKPNPVELSTYSWESTMENTSIGATNYVWDFGDGTGNVFSHSPTHAFPNEEAGSYLITLIASTNAGCADTAVAVVNLKEELLFYVPNTFTPDGDNFNNTFAPVFAAGYDAYNYTFLIFNRWGEIIFESHNTEVGWNGYYGLDGKECQSGTYTWKIEVGVRSTEETKVYTGHVNLLR